MGVWPCLWQHLWSMPEGRHNFKNVIVSGRHAVYLNIWLWLLYMWKILFHKETLKENSFLFFFPSHKSISSLLISFQLSFGVCFSPDSCSNGGVWGDICQHFFVHRQALCLVSEIERRDGCSIHKTSVSWNEFLEYCQVIWCNIKTLCFRVPRWWKSTPAFSQVEVQFPPFSGNVEYNFHAKWQERWKPWSEMFRNLARI